MGNANACYNPNVFNPDNKPLLSKGDWQMIQGFLVDAANLPITEAAFPDPKSIPIFKSIHDTSHVFQTETMPKANGLANKLYNYGQKANATFAAVIKLMDQDPIDKEALGSLYASLEKTASASQAEAEAVYTGTKSYSDSLTVSQKNLEKVVNEEVSATGGLKSQVEILKNDITSEKGAITSAQASITHDKKVIKDTVYYSWIPLVGTIVALVEIIEKEKDIKKQFDIINANIKLIQEQNKKVTELNGKIAQLVYAQNFNNGQIKQIGAVTPSLQKIQGAWGTIAKECGDVLGNIKDAQQQDLKTNACLAAVALTTAANEWHDVANDAHDFMLNFYITPVEKMKSKKKAG